MEQERKGERDALSGFVFEKLPRPAKTDAAARARFEVVDGTPDPNSGPLSKLNDGKLPHDSDEPEENFFFAAGSKGGRILIDLTREVAVASVNTYSWHPSSRGPQAYVLYGAAGTNAEAPSTKGQSLENTGWTELASVHPEQESGRKGGQYAVSISGASGTLGKFRYLLLAIRPTEEEDAFGNTFYSEIDVLEKEPAEPVQLADNPCEFFTIADGQAKIILDVSETPDLADWARTNVIPMVTKWYPELLRMLPGSESTVPKLVTINFRKDMRGVAATSGTTINCAAGWFRQNLQGEALGAVFHELVHVVQRYGRVRNPTPVPGWLTEGIADYVRWFRFEPDARGAAITSANLPKARYDASYRITANFLNWVTTHHSENLVRELNSAIREGRYRKEMWKELTGKDLQELGQQWRAEQEQRLAGSEPKQQGDGK